MQTKVFIERPKMLSRYSNESLQRYTSNLLCTVVCDFTLVCHCTIFELIQTVQVPALLDGAKILRKRSTVWVGRTNVTDDRQTIDIRTARAIRASGRFLWPILYLVNRPATVDFYCAMSRPMHSADYDVATCLSVCPSDTRLYCVETA